MIHQVLYKVEEINDEIYVKILVYNQKVHHPWSYSYVTESYPTKDIKYAKKFESYSVACK